MPASRSVLRGMKHLFRWWAACAVCGCAPEVPLPDTHRISVCWTDGSQVDSGWVRVLGARPSNGTWGSGSPYEALSDTLRIGAGGTVRWPRSGSPVALEVAAFHPAVGWLPSTRVPLETPESVGWQVPAATPTWYRFHLSRTPGLWNPPARYYVFPEWTSTPDPGYAWSDGVTAHADAWFDPHEPAQGVLVWPDVLPAAGEGAPRIWSIHAQQPDGLVRFCGTVTTAAGPALDTLSVPVTP